VAAQIAAVRIQLAPPPPPASPGGPAQPGGPAGITPADLQAAGRRLSLLTLDPGREQQLTAEVLQTALGTALAGQPVGSGQLLGCGLTERELRFGLERSYRALARLAPDQVRRIELVDLANDVRPRTWL
jgi:serine/threonine-protein kinase PknG